MKKSSSSRQCCHDSLLEDCRRELFFKLLHRCAELWGAVVWDRRSNEPWIDRWMLPKTWVIRTRGPGCGGSQPGLVTAQNQSLRPSSRKPRAQPPHPPKRSRGSEPNPVSPADQVANGNLSAACLDRGQRRAAGPAVVAVPWQLAGAGRHVGPWGGGAQRLLGAATRGGSGLVARVGC
eukprot:SAG31_NODE_12882_length_909_cov_1.393827_1_plen_177_part_10